MDEEEPGDSTKIGPLVGKRKTELQVVMFVNKWGIHHWHGVRRKDNKRTAGEDISEEDEW